MESGLDYLVMASHLPLKRITATVRFFRGVSAIRRQLATADGLVGYTLRAKAAGPRLLDPVAVAGRDGSARVHARYTARRADDLAAPLHGADEIHHLEDLRSRRTSEPGSGPPAPGVQIALSNEKVNGPASGVAGLWADAVANRLQGMAIYLLSDELLEVADHARAAARAWSTGSAISAALLPLIPGGSSTAPAAITSSAPPTARTRG